MADLHKRSVQEAVNLSVGGSWSTKSVATHAGTAATNTVHLLLDENTAQIGIHSTVDLLFNFSATETDVSTTADLILPAGTLVFLTIPRSLGNTIYFNHLGNGSTGSVRIVEV